MLNITFNQKAFSCSGSRTGRHRTFWTIEQHWTFFWNIPDS